MGAGLALLRRTSIADLRLDRDEGRMLFISLGCFDSLADGCQVIAVFNRQRLEADLEDNWAVVAEAIQTILRREGYPHPYEALKHLTRTNQKITEQSIHDFIQTLEVDEKIKKELMAITPQNYTGV